MLSVIYCIDSNGVLGIEERDETGNLKFRQPINCKVDKRYFLQVTKNKTVIMGGNTARSLLDETNGLLPGRHHVVLTSNKELASKLQEIGLSQQIEVTIFDNLDGLRHFIRSKSSEDLMLIGGANLFYQLEDLVERFYVTEFDVDEQYQPLENRTIEKLVTMPIIGSCKSGLVEFGFTRLDCKKFQDVDFITGREIQGWFSEYASNFSQNI